MKESESMTNLFLQKVDADNTIIAFIKPNVYIKNTESIRKHMIRKVFMFCSDKGDPDYC